MIELHSSPTPNGQKVMIMLEETGLEWKHFDVNIRLGEQFTPEFLKLSPNNKIPAIIDTDGPGGGRYTMMESGAILLYLAREDRQVPAEGCAQALRHAAVAHLPDGARRPDVRAGQPLQQLRQGQHPVREGPLQQRVGPHLSRARQPAARQQVDRLRRIHDRRHGDLSRGPKATRIAASTRRAIRTSCAGSKRWKRVRRCSGTTRWRRRSASA